jgi:hypothetical protein
MGLTKQHNNGVVLDYTYDSNSNRTKMVTTRNGAADNTTYYQYDAFNHLDKLFQNFNIAIMRGVAFNPNLQGQHSTIARYSGGSVDSTTGAITLSSPVSRGLDTFTYEPATGLLKEIGNFEVATLFEYDHLKDGQINWKRRSAGPKWNYTYTPHHELETVTGATSASYVNDDNFNRMSDGGQIGLDNRIKQNSAFAYAYDNEDNLIEKISISGTSGRLTPSIIATA